MQYLKQSTASQSVLIGPFIDDTDGKTAETALTIANTDIRLSANGGNMFAKTSGGGTHDEIGYYSITLDATDTATVGRLQVSVHQSGSLPVYHEFQVLEENVYDAVFGASGALGTDIASILAGTVTNAAGADIAADIIAVKAETVSILEDTGTTLDGKITDLQGVGFVEGTHSNVSILERGNAAWTGSPITSHSGTAQAGSASTLQLAASGASAIDDTYNGQVIYIISGTGASQSRAIADYTGSTTTATVVTNWATAPDNTSVYEIYPDEITEITAAPDADTVAGAVWDLSTTTHTQGGTFGEQLKTDLDSALTKVTTLETDWNNGGRLDLILDTIAADTTTDIPALIATAQADLDILTGTDGVTLATTQALYAPAKAGDNMGTVSSVTGNVDGNVGGNVTGSVGSLTGHTVQTGDTFALANGLTGFAAIDTVVDAIKVKTDGLNFTGTEVDANVEQINGTTVLGAGTSGDKWRA